MKHFLIVSCFIISNSTLHSQIDFGFKAGVNFDSMGDLSYTENFTNPSNLRSKTGFHIVVYSDFRIPFFNLRQELDYSKNISSLNEEMRSENIKLENYKKELPDPLPSFGEYEDKTLDALQSEIVMITAKIEDLEPVNMLALEELEELVQ